jgi:hypothetical protein
MKSFFMVGALALGSLLLAAPAQALTPQQIAQFVHDSDCSHGNHSITCTTSTPGEATITGTVVGPSPSQGQVGTAPAGCDAFEINVAGLCVFKGPAYDSFYHGASVTTVSSKTPTCTVTSATLHVPNNPFNVGGYSVSTSGPTTTNGAC